MERVALLFDVHVPYHDEQAYELALDYLKKLRPAVTKIVLAGDFVDFYKVSYWKSDPNRMPFKDEVAIVKEELKNLKRRFPRRQIDYLEGNHEVRLYNHVRENAPELLYRNDIESVLDLRTRQIKYISNIARMCDGKQPYKLGKLFVLHGHEKKVSMGAINLAKLFYAKCLTNVIAGHHHRTDFSLNKKLDGTHEGAWTVGTLGKMAEPYLPINNWNAGFAFVDVEEDGYFEVHNKIILEGRVMNG